MSDDVKHAGCCSRCNVEIREVTTRFPEGPLHGWPRGIGAPLENSWRIEYVLLDGTRATVSCCENCKSWMCDPANFSEMWQKVIRTFLFEERDDVRAALPCAPRTAEQRSAALAGILKIQQSPPIGVIAIVRHQSAAELRVAAS